MFSSNQNLALPVPYIYKRPLLRAQPLFSCTPSQFVHILELGIFATFRRVPSFYFFLWFYITYLMALPCVLVLEDSFIRRLRTFVLGSPQKFSVDFDLSNLAVIKWHGIGGRTVTKTVQPDLHLTKSFKPDIVLLQLGSNDLTSETALCVDASIDDFVRLQNDLYHVQVIYVRQGQSAFVIKPSC